MYTTHLDLVGKLGFVGIEAQQWFTIKREINFLLCIGQ